MLRSLAICSLLPLIIVTAPAVKASDSIPPKTVFSIGFAYLNTSRVFRTHVHNRYSTLDFNTDEVFRSAAGAVGINMLHTFKPRYRVETGIYLSFNYFRSLQYNLVGHRKINDSTEEKYYYDDERKYRLAMATVPVKIIYHLSPRVHSWYVAAGINTGRILMETVPNGTHTHKVHKGILLRDLFGNEIIYRRYFMDYCGGIGKFTRLGPTLQLRFEGGYSGSVFSVLKDPDRGRLSAFYLQFGLISLY
jgi:hypothetical protein